MKRPQSSMMIVLFAGLGLMLAAAAWVEVDQGVRAQGQIIPDSRTQVIQSVDGGVLMKIMAREGQAVRAGEMLAVLEKDRSQAGVEEAHARIGALEAALIRAKAEAAGLAPRFPADAGPMAEFVATQNALYEQRLRALQADTVALQDARAKSQEALEMAKDELRVHEALMATGDTSRMDLLRARRQVTDQEARLVELQGRLTALKNKYTQDAQAEVVKVSEELSSQRYKLDERRNVLEHTNIVSPMDGVVKVLRMSTVGGVLRPGDELMQISPSEDELVLEIKVNPADVGLIHVGLPVNLRLDAFDYATQGMAHGELVYLSADTLTEQGPNGQVLAFYRGHVRIDPKSLPRDRGGKPVVLRPGMTAVADIRTGERSILSYLLKPIQRGLSGAMKEH